MSVIKADSAIKQGEKLIKTDERTVQIKAASENSSFTDEILLNYENLAETIILKAKKESENIISKALSEAHIIEQQAYEKGYHQGQQNGYEDGYKESYEVNIEKAKIEAAQINDEAMHLLNSAKEVYEEYLKSKEKEVIELSVKMAECILREKLERDQGLNKLIFEAIDISKKSKSYIIKCHPIHIDSVKEKVETWKHMLALNADIFVIEDLTAEPGNVVIEKENGKIQLGMDISMEKLKEAFGV